LFPKNRLITITSGWFPFRLGALPLRSRVSGQQMFFCAKA